MKRQALAPRPSLGGLSTSVLAHVLSFMHMIEAIRLVHLVGGRGLVAALSLAYQHYGTLALDAPWEIILRDDFVKAQCAMWLAKMIRPCSLHTIRIDWRCNNALHFRFLEQIAMTFRNVHTVSVCLARGMLHKHVLTPLMTRLVHLRSFTFHSAAYPESYSWDPLRLPFASTSLTELNVHTSIVDVRNMPARCVENLEEVSC